MSAEGTSSPSGASDERYEQIRARARRRQPWLLALPIVGGTVIGPLIGRVTHSSHQHDSIGVFLAGSLIGLLLGAVVVVGAVCLIRRFGSSRLNDLFSVPPSAGLSRRERRDVARAVRRGTPSADPVLRRIELDSAERALRQGRRGLAMMAVFLVLDVGFAIGAQHSTAEATLLVVIAVLIAFAIGLGVRVQRGARRYLAGVTTLPGG